MNTIAGTSRRPSWTKSRLGTKASFAATKDP
jgi:hypothetical protein